MLSFGYEALSALSEAEKRGLASQDIVLLSYPLKIRVLRRRPKLQYCTTRPFLGGKTNYQLITS